MADTNPTEQWRPIKSYGGTYEISDRGKVWSHIRSKRILKSFPNKQGYLRVTLCANGKMKTVSIHSLVLEAFVRPRPEGLVCDHIDGNPANNHISNLEWVTQAENLRRGKSPFIHRGSKNCRSKLDEEKVLQIRKRHAEGGISRSALAREYHVCKQLVCNVVNRKTWKSVA